MYSLFLWETASMGTEAETNVHIQDRGFMVAIQDNMSCMDSTAEKNEIHLQKMLMCQIY